MARAESLKPIDWPGIYARIATTTGWTLDYIMDEVTLPRLRSLLRYWSEHPPVHELVAAFVGYKPPQPAQYDDPRSLGAALSAAGIKGQRIRRKKSDAR
jgi:hypothetical protein